MAKAIGKRFKHGLGMVCQRGEINTFSLLTIFLLSVTAVSFGSLYFDSQHKNKLLSAEVTELKNSQVLLMVPDEQAAVMADWMANNPQFVQSFVEKARKGESTVLPIGPGVSKNSANNSGATERNNHAAQASSQRQAQPKKQAQEQVEDQVVLQSKLSNQEVLQPNTNVAKPNTEKVSTVSVKSNAGLRNVRQDEPSKAVTVVESEDGVKLIRLPHGGVRVTTREPDS
ncbi:hypothetical protein [Shewanella pneumatophori]|uniref:Membrane anchored protein in chemotaxis locus n=1 Tax=Shewanella pneumatophori TaxID=314092 RepID=A0A9X1ZDE5_9GAMM|nr:hypothetical protein [Shewanella pneumatophori]MCL1139613.1 hypothetical protein [Shewanella pneumatophori]